MFCFCSTIATDCRIPTKSMVLLRAAFFSPLKRLPSNQVGWVGGGKLEFAKKSGRTFTCLNVAEAVLISKNDPVRSRFFIMLVFISRSSSRSELFAGELYSLSWITAVALPNGRRGTLIDVGGCFVRQSAVNLNFKEHFLSLDNINFCIIKTANSRWFINYGHRCEMNTFVLNRKGCFRCTWVLHLLCGYMSWFVLTVIIPFEQFQ